MRRFFHCALQGHKKEQEAELVAGSRSTKRRPAWPCRRCRSAQGDLMGIWPIEVQRIVAIRWATSGGNLWNFHVLFAVQPLSEG